MRIFLCLLFFSFFARALTPVFSAETPIPISTIHDLQRIGNEAGFPLHGSYFLINDIDASVADEWNEDAGFAPIGSKSFPFNGIFDGQGHRILNLTIHRPGEHDVALFAAVGASGEIRNLGIGGGGIRGENAAPLAAVNEGMIENCWATANVTGLSGGGLVAENSGTISGSFASGEVLGGGGGLVGRNWGDIVNCHATGNVRRNGPFYSVSGGLIGVNYGHVENSHATGTVDGGVTGGLVGENVFPFSRIESCYATGTVWGEGTAGGLAGVNEGEIRTSFSTGFVSGRGAVGGLAGGNWGGVIADSFAVGPVKGERVRPGLLGGAGGDIRRSYAAGKILRLAVDSFPDWTHSGGGTSTYLWDAQVTGMENGFTGGGRTTAEMMRRETFAGWDFTNTWAIAEGAGYPFLRAFAFEDHFDLTIEAEHGTVTVSPEFSGIPWSPVWLTAEPDSGYVFAGWVGDGLHEARPIQVNPLPIVPFRSATVRAVFLPEEAREIGTIADLARIGQDPEWPLHGNYRLVSDIDASETRDWNGGNGFEPIGQMEPFSGTLDGQGHRILNLHISRTGSPAALFSVIARGGVVANLGIDEGTITGDSVAAGLVWENNGSIRNCYARTDVRGGFAAGLVFVNYGLIENCYAAGTVTFVSRSSSSSAGGLVGRNHGEISYSYAAGKIFADQDRSRVGGLVAGGSTSRPVTASFWNIDGSGVDRSFAGRGLSSDEMKTADIFRNAGWGNGNWRHDGGSDYPRLAWEDPALPIIPPPAPVPLAGSGTPSDPFLVQTAADFALLSWHAGLLDKHIRLTRDLDLQDVEIHPIGEMGPFAGVFDGDGFSVSNGAIERPGGVQVGLFSRIWFGGRVERFAANEMRIVGLGQLGVIVAENRGSILGCSVTGEVVQTASNDGYGLLGGLAGLNLGFIARSSADVAANANEDALGIGGFVGENWQGTIVSCYSRGPVSGGFTAGGFAGEARGGEISQSYAAGHLFGGAEDGDIGGFAGEQHSSRADLANFWNTETGLGDQSGAIGKTTAEMKSAGTFVAAGWDFETVWQIDEGVDYPVLRDLQPELIAPTTFAEWLDQNQIPSSERGLTDDPGGYGISNLERYTLGLHPHHPERSDLPVVAVRSGDGESGDWLTISFWETAGAADIECYVEASDDLENWELFYPEDHRTVERWEGNRRLVTYRDERPVSDGARRFLRVSIWFNAERNEYWWGF